MNGMPEWKRKKFFPDWNGRVLWTVVDATYKTDGLSSSNGVGQFARQPMLNQKEFFARYDAQKEQERKSREEARRYNPLYGIPDCLYFRRNSNCEEE